MRQVHVATILWDIAYHTPVQLWCQVCLIALYSELIHSNIIARSSITRYCISYCNNNLLYKSDFEPTKTEKLRSFCINENAHDLVFQMVPPFKRHCECLKRNAYRKCASYSDPITVYCFQFPSYTPQPWRPCVYSGLKSCDKPLKFPGIYSVSGDIRILWSHEITKRKLGNSDRKHHGFDAQNFAIGSAMIHSNGGCRLAGTAIVLVPSHVVKYLVKYL